VVSEARVSVLGAGDRIRAAMLDLEGVTVQPHRFGGHEYRLGRREIGHVHGNSLVGIPFSRKTRDQVLTAGQAEPHHLLPDSGWVRPQPRAPRRRGDHHRPAAAVLRPCTPSGSRPRRRLSAMSARYENQPGRPHGRPGQTPKTGCPQIRRRDWPSARRTSSARRHPCAATAATSPPAPDRPGAAL